MRISIDATPLLMRSGGVKNYVYYWIRSLQRSAGGDSVALFPFLGRLGELNHEKSAVGLLPTLARLAFVRAARVRGNRVLDLIGRGLDLFHATNIHVTNPPRNARLTFTLYDLTCWLMPELHTRANIEGSLSVAARAFPRTDGFIAISENTKQDAVRVLGLKPEKIWVIYPGVAESFFRQDEGAVERVREKYGLRQPYVLSVGTLEPRKNLDVLLDAYETLPPSVRAEYELVVAGPVGWGAGRTLARMLQASAGVRRLGYVPESDLPALTAGAAVFAYPSLYEGFGLPVAQAMAAGVPVLTSNISSLPEVAGPAALLVDPRSVEETRCALDRLVSSESLRTRLSAEGVRLAGRYHWEQCAEMSWRFFHSVV